MRLATLMAAALLAGGVPHLSGAPVRISVLPKNPMLFGEGSEQRLLVIAHQDDGSAEDVTSQAEFRSARPEVATVSDQGVVHARAFGGARIEARYDSLADETIALVQQADSPRPATFSGDVLPALTKLGCNNGNCHGTMNGQNGFKLSLFGYHPTDDFKMIVEGHNGRRINLPDPADSLLLRKPTFQVAHGGGAVLDADSDTYRTILEWIRGGAKGDPAVDRRLVDLAIHPSEVVLHGADQRMQLIVTARYSDGTESDFTGLAHFESNDADIAAVDESGMVISRRRGETAVLVRGMGVVRAARVGVVTERFPVPKMESDHFIDKQVFKKLRDLHVPPSPPADDATFLRRVYLGIIGEIPSADEVRRFLTDSAPGKRGRVVEELLDRPEYADFWSLYWGDHLNNTKQLLYNKGPYTFTRWLFEAFRDNMPYDEFVRLLMTSSGNMYDSPATSFYPLMKKPLDLAAQASQLFLGVRIDCARCHNHPMERWTQADYNGMAAFFAQVKYKSGVGPRNNERTLYLDFDQQFKHPDNDRTYRPKFLGGPFASARGPTDRRAQLVDWMTSADNPYFSRAIVNRMWKQFMGRGLVEPVDDFRDTNPPSNPDLLDDLATSFVQSGYDLQALIRTITSSQAYQLSWNPTESNRDDMIGHSRFYVRRLTAEQLLDSISRATGVPEAFVSFYPGTRAAQLPEPEVPSYFLDVFDRPSRQLVSDRATTNSLNQALHLISGDTVQDKVSDERGALKGMLDQGLDTEQILKELYLRTVSRFPTGTELREAIGAVASADTRERGIEDVFWALLNSKEFLYQH